MNKSIPTWLALILIIATGLLVYWFTPKNTTNNYTVIKREKDSITAEFIKQDEAKVDRSKEITKKINNEKPIIVDTTDAYKREYISNYSPSAVLEP